MISDGVVSHLTTCKGIQRHCNAVLAANGAGYRPMNKDEYELLTKNAKTAKESCSKMINTLRGTSGAGRNAATRG